MKVSVIIPAHNEQAYIEDCLRSLLAQTRLPDEILVVDNNCSDDTVKLAKSFDGVQIIKENRQGIPFANKRGLDMARGDLLVRIDADTRLPSNWLRNVVVLFKDLRVAAVTGPGYFYDLPLLKAIHIALLTVYFGWWRIIQGHHTLWASNMAIRRSVWQKVSSQVCLHQQIHEDFDLALHLGRTHQIIFNSKLMAAVSLRRLRRIREYGNYLLMWPRTILFHKRRRL